MVFCYSLIRQEDMSDVEGKKKDWMNKITFY